MTGQLRCEELCNSYPLSSSGSPKEDEMDVARRTQWEMRNSYKILTVKPSRKTWEQPEEQYRNKFYRNVMLSLGLLDLWWHKIKEFHV
jgi:hypothetical protein